MIGGRNSSEGNVYAYNPSTGVDGPVCDDMWNIEDVSDGLYLRWPYYASLLLFAFFFFLFVFFY